MHHRHSGCRQRGRVQDGDRVGRINRSSDPAYNKDPEQRRLDLLRGRKPSPPAAEPAGRKRWRAERRRSCLGHLARARSAGRSWRPPRRTIALGGARTLLAPKIGATRAATAWSDGAPQKAVSGGLPRNRFASGTPPHRDCGRRTLRELSWRDARVLRGPPVPLWRTRGPLVGRGNI
ncbi:hypothetical protein NDU88_003283 [Pleurodeles waltl]|uniref:Uncharacterized protein n=1 Tax=Pleurodeles waltl TaxID=8319 RepID=A0AAV7WP05_PLEWA|nr:hypothetical protein NDU88_003283 [Pleurodeles waltl]